MTEKPLTFPALNLKGSLAEEEKKISEFWKKEKIFEKSISTKNPKNKLEFFDGPPFATGTPHYGHLLAGTIKDTIPRYKSMQGHYIKRNWGWDCHGVPVEFLVEQENRIGGKPEIEKMGIAKYNEMCRSVVLRFREEWKNYVERTGRFVDFENDYKTMNPEYIESVWWVFKTLYEKGLIYEGEKIIAYSPKLSSPLSNFEAGQNYRDIDDPAITVKFEIEGEPKSYFLAWTTTPWTLPENLALAVNPNLMYVKVKHEGTKDAFWVGENYAKENELTSGEWKIVDHGKGMTLAGKKYNPLFPYFATHKNAFQIILGDFVSETEGCGIVHIAPNFGEDDAAVATKNNIEPLEIPIDETGYFTEKIPELKGKYFRYDKAIGEHTKDNANDWVLETLKSEGKIFHRAQVRHSYPHCWRTDCALMYRGIKTWFVNIQKIKKELIAENKNIHWIPSHIKSGRFGKGLESAPDWAISRNRYWGAPLPVWKCDKTGEIQIIGSKKELEDFSGKKLNDLHRHFIDQLTWKNKNTGGTMKRIPEVLDCWFESGSMPYANKHYPFSTKEFVPADFIAEGIDQTRGWFYTLHVLGVALLGKNIFKNVITNGIILAEDGNKMSKSKKNYPDPMNVIDKYGADALRFYLSISPAAQGESLKFSERGVEEVLKSVILPLRSTYQFFSTYANIDEWSPTKFIFMRHGEGEHNIKKIYSGKETNEHSLTEKGKKEVKARYKTLPDFDILMASPFVRTKETAEIIKKETDFKGEIIVDNRLKESDFGNLEGKEISEDERFYLPSFEGEFFESIIHRVQNFMENIAEAYPGKTICVITHGDILRAAQSITSFSNITTAQDWYALPILEPGEAIVQHAIPKPETELDIWILSELQELIKTFRKNMDQYLIPQALEEIPKFIEKLNNWYLRRSRRRFWKEGLEVEKISGYETLHHTLLTLSKILTPICPFWSEQLFQNLVGYGSVNLEVFPNVKKEWIKKSLEEKINISREIVGLSAGIRANKKIKLRQPLKKLQFLTTQKEALDLEIIKEEANVEEVEILKSIKNIATPIVKVDAKKVGPRLGAKVQDIIKKGKEGKFIELENGQIRIGGQILEANEFERGFLCNEGIEAASSTKVVVLLDTEISQELEIKGMAREIIRTIQEQRKTKNFAVSDRISIRYQTNSKLIEESFGNHAEMIAGEVLAEEIIKGGNIPKELEVETISIEGELIILEIQKTESEN